MFIVEALEMIAFRHHLAKYGDTFVYWDSASRTEAQQIMASITSFEFIVVYQFLSHLAGITVKLQKSVLDIIQAHETRCLEKLRVEQASAVLIAPVWQNQLWYPMLLQSLADIPILLPPCQDIVL